MACSTPSCASACSNRVAWARGVHSRRGRVAVAVAGSVDDDHPEPLGEAVHEAVDREVLDQGAVAVDQHQGLALAALDVVQAHAVHVEKATDGRVFALGVSRHLGRVKSSSAQSSR